MTRERIRIKAEDYPGKLKWPNGSEVKDKDGNLKGYTIWQAKGVHEAFAVTGVSVGTAPTGYEAMQLLDLRSAKLAARGMK